MTSGALHERWNRSSKILCPVALVAGQLSLVAILIVGWVCGLPPSLVAWGLATLAFAYSFTPPLDSLALDSVELPHLIIFAPLGC